MKSYIVLATLVVLAAGQGTYNPEYDKLDIDSLAANPEKLRNWVHCFVDQGPCNEFQSQFKADIPEAIQQGCARCSPALKVILKKFFATLNNSPAEFELFRNKYDPDNKYFGQLLKVA